MALQPTGGSGHRLLMWSPESIRSSQKRRVVYYDKYENYDDDDDVVDNYLLPATKRRRPFEGDVHFCPELPPSPEPFHHDIPEFLVLREVPFHSVATEFGVMQRPASSAAMERTASWPMEKTAVFGVMERTASGLSISADTFERTASTELLDDAVAAQRVRHHMDTFRQRSPDSKSERILRSLINPKPYAAEYEIDNEALESIFFAANEIFFNGRLSQRVTWDWSHSSSPQYDSSVIGTTALRRASKRGFETLIVLSSPILQDRKYSRRLLISTFLHELIHSYLFICCGFGARRYGGHTPGFHTIAKLIDDWAGPDSFLYLCSMEADLECFRVKEEEGGGGGHHGGHGQGNMPEPYHHVYPCSGFMDSRRAEPRGDDLARDEYEYGRDWWGAPSPPCWHR